MRKRLFLQSEYGADAIGFVFAESKREISLEHASSIISKLPKETKKVGVFVNPSKERIDEVVQKQELILFNFMAMKHQNFVVQSLIQL